MKSLAMPLAAAVVLIALTTYVQGNITERWADNSDEILTVWAERLKTGVPLEIGDWVGTESEEATPEGIQKIAGFVGEKQITFTNMRTKEIVQAVLMVGPGRRVSVHTPDKCLRGAGWA